MQPVFNEGHIISKLDEKKTLPNAVDVDFGNAEAQPLEQFPFMLDSFLFLFQYTTFYQDLENSASLSLTRFEGDEPYTMVSYSEI